MSIIESHLKETSLETEVESEGTAARNSFEALFFSSTQNFSEQIRMVRL
jgi:hypothetical protein